MLNKGDEIIICLFCLKIISKERAERERMEGLACRKGGHVLGTAVVTHTPKD